MSGGLWGERLEAHSWWIPGQLCREPDAICTVPWCMEESPGRRWQKGGPNRKQVLAGLPARKRSCDWSAGCVGDKAGTLGLLGIDSFPLAASRESWCLICWSLAVTQLSRAPCAHSKYVVLCRIAFLCREILVFLIPPHGYCCPQSRACCLAYWGLSPPLTWEQLL